MIKVKQEITCPYCQNKAVPDTKSKALLSSNTRYACEEGGHYFAVPTMSVLIKE